MPVAIDVLRAFGTQAPRREDLEEIEEANRTGVVDVRHAGERPDMGP